MYWQLPITSTARGTCSAGRCSSELQMAGRACENSWVMSGDGMGAVPIVWTSPVG